MSVSTESRPLTVKQAKFAAEVAGGKPKAQAFRENYKVAPGYEDTGRRKALETAKKPNVAAEIRRLTWLSFPPLEDTAGMRGQAVRILSDLSRTAKSEEVRFKSALALYKIAETTRAASNPQVDDAEQDRLLSSLRKLYATMHAGDDVLEGPDIGPAPPAYDDEPIDITAIALPAAPGEPPSGE